MRNAPKPTQQTLKVLDAIFSHPNTSGAEIGKRTKLASGTLYPILLRLEEAGLLSSEWEVEDPQTLGRPRRRFYRVTGEGVRYAKVATAEQTASLGRLSWA